jgi:hypothetical protein
MPLFCQESTAYAGYKYQHGKDPGLPPAKISSADQENQWDKKIREDQSKPQARTWSLIYVWINGFRCHFFTPKQAEISISVL